MMSSTTSSWREEENPKKIKRGVKNNTGANYDDADAGNVQSKLRGGIGEDDSS